MNKRARLIGAGLSLFVCGVVMNGLWAQTPAPAAPANSAPTSAAGTVPDHARAYYHFMLARRYRELAGAFNRGDYVDRSISEYKQAMEADPGSLYLRIELAELYWRIARVGDAVREAEAVLKVDPNYADAHRLLANIYLHSLGEGQSEKSTKESLRKAIDQLEALTRIEPNDTESNLKLGRLYKLDNQPAKAEEVFRRILNGDPNSKSAIGNLAELYIDEGDFDQAIDLLNKIPEGSRDARMLGLLGFAYTQNHEFEKATAAYQRALSQDADNQEIRKAYAEALMGAGNPAAARAELQKVLSADPEDATTYLRLAQVDRQAGQFDQARQELEKAKSLAPDNLEIPYQLALLEDSVGNEDKAVQIMQGLVKQSERANGQYTPGEANNRAIFLERLGVMYRTQEKYDQAMATFREITALGSGMAPRAEGLVIETLRLKREPDKALEEVASAVQKYPQDRSLRMLQASILGEQGKVEEAIKNLKALLNNAPSDREVYLSIGQVYSQAKRYPEAEAAAKKSLELSTKPEDREYPYFLLGSIYEREKRYDLAEEQFKKVLAMNPVNAAAANYLGYMLADRGVRLEESVQYIRKALDLEPNNGAYLDSLGWAYYKIGKYDLAEVNLEKAAKLVSNDPTIHEHLGHVYLRVGKKKQALQEWERALKAWPTAASSDFDAEQAAKLQKELDDLKLQTAKDNRPQR
jgi:tetratricopeptide (TPR) repeat protein